MEKLRITRYLFHKYLEGFLDCFGGIQTLRQSQRKNRLDQNEHQKGQKQMFEFFHAQS